MPADQKTEVNLVTVNTKMFLIIVATSPENLAENG